MAGKKFKEAIAQIVTQWYCPECEYLNVVREDKINYKKQCCKCRRFFLLVKGILTCEW